ncbi:hypothetical protein Pmi06nite_04060 [Planotetraspora mira]|uniref:Uncharacterized protein n=1 Tax=Planotetraspora mira TaxID=58121 RepID=A0A8J3TIV2_9ACTN|nr:hypothetical protein Pmi06nite_04060 [Planotetraspora mira]
MTVVPSGQYGLAIVWYRIGLPDAVTPSQNEVAVAVPDGSAAGVAVAARGEDAVGAWGVAACAAEAVPAVRAAQHVIVAIA